MSTKYLKYQKGWYRLGTETKKQRPATIAAIRHIPIKLLQKLPGQ